MILYVKGNLFQSPAQTLVNTVNTVGVMGKGVALEFKRLFPEMYAQYRALCESGQFKVGQLWLYKTPQKWVLNFPTKEHWRAPSRLEYVEAGLKKFVQVYSEMGIHSIAFPPLGCGNGQLDFETQVRPRMEHYLKNLPIDIFIYPDRKSQFVEHLNVEEMEAWLRSEPASLPFSEVWQDLSAALRQQQAYQTAEGQAFTARLNEQEQTLEIESPSQTFKIHADALLSFWQQLRAHGFSMTYIAPGLGQELPYLVPIFSQLPYIAPARVTEDYRSLREGAVVGLQLIPSAKRPESHSERPAQLSLFPLG
jgi:O-acetyl-ADP-ribose deacetylase (regulator of RNase III)